MILTPHTKVEPKHNPNKAHIKNRPLINNANNPRNTQTQKNQAKRVTTMIEQHAQRGGVAGFAGLLPVDVVEGLVGEHAEGVDGEGKGVY